MMKLILNGNNENILNAVNCTEMLRNDKDSGVSRELSIQLEETMDKLQTLIGQGMVISQIDILGHDEKALFTSTAYKEIISINNNIGINSGMFMLLKAAI